MNVRSFGRIFWAVFALSLPSAGRASPRPGADLMDEGYARKASGDLTGAAAAFERAKAAGFDAQRVDLELSYLDLETRRIAAARARLKAAAHGPDPLLAAQARGELDALPRTLRRDLYVEAFGWERMAGAERRSNVVPMLRLRALVQPLGSVPLDGYVFAQATRDLLSSDAGSVPQIYADSRAIAGAGLQLRLFGSRAALFAQAGPAFALVHDGRGDMLLDFRAGAVGNVESRGCSPTPHGGVSLRVLPCGDAYGAAVYFSRFDEDLVAVARGRAGATWLLTGPVAWTLLLETQASADRIGHPYDNFFEAGLGHRWRLLRPVRVDLLAGLSSGVVLRGRTVEPVPTDRTYLEARLLAATYSEF
jgi:hypothetical protein